MNLFRVRGIQLAVHGSFFVLLALNAYFGWSDGGTTGLLWETAALLAFFTCVVLHELGHSFTAMHFGIGVRRILLMPIGGMAEFTEMPRQPRREFLITIAGPAVNFVIAGLLWLVLPPATGGEADIVNWTDFGHVLLQWNLLMGCFNFLPAFPMDGGRVLRAALASRMSYVRATYWAATVGKVLCVLGMLAAAYFDQLLVIVLFGFIFFVGELEYRAVRRKDLEDAQLRVAVDELYGHPPASAASPLKEPPLLSR